MPFRERVRRVFGRGSVSSDNPLTTTDTTTSTKSKKEKKKSKKEEYKNWPDNIYKPHEMPRPKYRQQPDEKHTSKLNAFTWDSMQSLRRRSGVSQYSPMGSRLPSISSKTQSVSPSRNQSIAQVFAEADDDGDVTNVGLSRQSSAQSPTRIRRISLSKGANSPPDTANDLIPPPIVEQSSQEHSHAQTPLEIPLINNEEDGGPLDAVKTITLGQNRDQSMKHIGHAADRPFSEAELTHALTQIPIRQEAAVGA